MYHLEIEKSWINFEDIDHILKVTGDQRTLKNDLLAPYLLTKWIDSDQTCKVIAFDNNWERVHN